MGPAPIMAMRGSSVLAKYMSPQKRQALERASLGKLGEEICYQDKNWEAILDGIQTALLALVQAFTVLP